MLSVGLLGEVALYLAFLPFKAYLIIGMHCSKTGVIL